MPGMLVLAATLMALALSHGAANVLLRGHGGFERLSTTLLLWIGTMVLWVQILGTFGALAPGPAAGLALGCNALGGVWLARHLSLQSWWAQVRADARAPYRLCSEAWQTREPAALLCMLAAVIFGAAALSVWCFRSWAWDAVWYHVPITAYALQSHSTGWILTHIPWISSYPRNVEWLNAWACLIAGDERLNDSAQLPLVLLAALVVAAWSRRFGASRAVSSGLGAAFLCLPPVLLQLATSYVDIGCAAFFGAAIFFSSGPIDRQSRQLTVLAMGLYVGSKYSGVFHLSLWLPWFFGRGFVELQRSTHRGKTLHSFALSAMLLASMGSYSYVLNFVHTANPFFPFKVSLPGLGVLFDGPWSQHQIFGTVPQARLYFFGIPGELAKTWESWFQTSGLYWPDVRTGGFGPLFRWLLLPAWLAFGVQTVRRRIRWQQALGVVALFLMAFSVPNAWWPRYVLGGAIASLVAFAATLASIPFAWLRRSLAWLLVGFSVWGFILAMSKIEGPFPSRFREAWNAPPHARATLQLESWQWPEAWSIERDREIGPGAVITYDDGASFVGELFSPQTQTQVEFVPSTGAPSDFIRRLRAVHARWVGVRTHSAGERALIQAGAEFLFEAPRSDESFYRLQDPDLPGVPGQ